MKIHFSAVFALMLMLASSAFADGPNGGHGGAGRPTGRLKDESAQLLNVGHGGSGRSDKSGGGTSREEAGHGGSG